LPLHRHVKWLECAADAIHDHCESRPLHEYHPQPQLLLQQGPVKASRSEDLADCPLVSASAAAAAAAASFNTILSASLERQQRSTASSTASSVTGSRSPVQEQLASNGGVEGGSSKLCTASLVKMLHCLHR
jgi:hypothetical protein